MEQELHAVQAENVRLRAALAQSELPCVYCSLPRDEWTKCPVGFPGCARGDDAVGCPELGARGKVEELEAEIVRLRAGIKAVREGGDFEAWLADFSEALEQSVPRGTSD